MDAAHEWTDAEIKRLAERLRYHYRKSAREIQHKAEKRLADYRESNEKMRKRLKDGEITREQYGNWCSTQAAVHARDAAMVNELTERAMKATAEARSLISGTMPKVYAENANYMAFSIDSEIGYYTGFSLVNRDAVLEVAKKNPKLLPLSEPNYAKNARWHSQKFTSAILQGILQGESVGGIARRIESVTSMDYAASLRVARTAMTTAENLGRMSSMRRAAELGIEVRKKWVATLDGRTRDTHRQVDGEIVLLEEKFSNDLMEPGDPSGEPEEVYNCRCAMKHVASVSREVADDRWSRLPDDVDYEDWKSGVFKTDKHGKETKASKAARGM